MVGNTETPDVLIIEDTLSMAIMYERQLKKAGLSAQICQSGEHALIELRKGRVTTALLDLQLPDMNGLDIIRTAQEANLPITFIVITANGSVNTAVDAMRLGAYDFLIKPFAEERLLTSVKNALERTELRTTVTVLKQSLEDQDCPGFIGRSPAMLAVYKMIQNVADSKAPVFITGESGTGKEVTANAIHAMSHRADKPFIAINCAAIPENLMESEIFGHVKGAFTGAAEARKGAASQANGGTLFLDEICEMEIGLQAKLLRFLQTGQVKRVGSDWHEDVDVRIVCATNRHPMEEVREKRFREDLFYRLNVLSIELPPLRDRDDDVISLANSFLTGFSAEEQKSFKSISLEAERKLLDHNWPGNIRELQNTIRKAVVIYDGVELEPHMFSFTPEISAPAAPYQLIGEVVDNSEVRSANRIYVDLEQPFASIEKEIIEAAIKACNGSIPRASEMLDISPSTIYRKRDGWASLQETLNKPKNIAS